MATIEIKDAKGAAAGTVELSDAVFGIEPNVPVVHQVVRAQRASWRQGTSDTKTRGQVSGGGKKPFRQKGTGRARQGTTRAPQMAGGGTVFGPHPRSYAFRVNNKEVKLAMRSVLSAKLAEGKLFVVKPFEMERPKTKEAVAFLNAMGIQGQRTCIVVEDDAIEAYLSFRNIGEVNMIPVSEINTYELLDNKNLVICEDALSRVEEVLK